MGLLTFFKKNKKPLYLTNLKKWLESEPEEKEIEDFIGYKVKQGEWVDPEKEGEVHEADYTTQGWGHAWNGIKSYGYIRYGTGHYSGYGLIGATPLREGSIMLMKTESGKIGRFLVLSLERMRDPNDMFSAYIIGIGYKDADSTPASSG